MYYYILDLPNPETSVTRYERQLKPLLLQYGISGEMVSTHWGHSALELARLGLDKGYTSIIAVGDDFLVNQLTSAIVNTPAALGIIPYQMSTELKSIFAISDLATACRALQHHQTTEVSLAKIFPHTYILSDANLDLPAPTPCIIEVDDLYSLSAVAQSITFTRQLDLSLTSPNPAQSSWQRIFHRRQPANHQTLIYAQYLRINTSVTTNLLLCGKVIAKTPIRITREPGVLKIIKGYDIVKSNS